MSTRATQLKESVPDIEVQFYARIARGLLGSAMSIPTYFLLKSGLLKFGVPQSENWGILLFCFVAGFSERWFKGAIAAIARDETKPTSGPS